MNMLGIEFLLDRKGRRKAVLIDLKNIESQSKRKARG